MFRRLCLCFACALMMGACSPAANPIPDPPALVIEEHLLTAAPDISTERLVFHFAQGDQEAILAPTAPYKDFRAQAEQTNRQALAPFGYTLKDYQKTEPGYGQYFRIYHGDQLIADEVMYMKPISVNASHTDFLGIASLSDGDHMFTREHFTLMRPLPLEKQAYAFVGDRLLSLEMGAGTHGVSPLQVYLGDKLVYSSDFNDVSTYGAVDGPTAYGNHWALVLLDADMGTPKGPEQVGRVIQDGQDMNSVKGYEQSFQLAVLDGRPFYFFQKSGKIGVSFDGQEFAKDYDEVPHYNCCSPALLNPGISMNMVWFFARRGAAWYYVEAYVPVAPTK